MTRSKSSAESLPVSDGSMNHAEGKLIVAIDDNALVLDATLRILRGWKYNVVGADSDLAALARVGNLLPDLIIADYRLSNGKTGIKVIEALRSGMGVPVPALVISGDTDAEHLRHILASGHYLLHKPVSPTALRRTLNQILGG